MYATSRLWQCDYCAVAVDQPPPRGSDMLPSPPTGWAMVDVVTFLPAHSIKVSSGESVKVGDARDTLRRVFCPACVPALFSLVRRQG